MVKINLTKLINKYNLKTKRNKEIRRMSLASKIMVKTLKNNNCNNNKNSNKFFFK